MSGQRDLALRLAETTSVPGSGSNREMQEFWLLLAKRDWGTVLILPADPDGSTEALARSLALAGKNLSDRPVSAISVKTFGPSTARALAALAEHVSRGQKRLWRGSGVIEVEAESSSPSNDESDGYMAMPPGRVIIGVPSVLAEPAVLAVAQAVDLVVLGVQLGHTSMKAVQRSIELIGREKVAGCCLM